MAEHDDLVSMAGDPESTVAIVTGPAAGDETLMEPSGCEGRGEGSLSGEDGGEIMVEVVGSDVFVDGVPGQGDAENWNGEDSVASEGLERETGSVDGEGGAVGGSELQEAGASGGQPVEARPETRVEGLEDIAGSSLEQSHVATEEVAVSANEEDRGQHDREGDGSMVSCPQGSDVFHEEAQNSGKETGFVGSLVTPGSSCEETKAVAETVVVTVIEGSVDRGLIEEDMDKCKKSVKGVGGALDELPSQAGVLDDESFQTGIAAAVVCSSSVTQSLSMQTPVVTAEVARMVNVECLRNKEEADGCDAEEGNFHGRSSVDETVRLMRDKDDATHLDAESLNQHIEIAVGGELGLKDKEIWYPGGNSCSVGEDQQMEVDTHVDDTKCQVRLNTDFVSSCEPTEVRAGSENVTSHDGVSVNPDVGDQRNAVLSRVGVDTREVGSVSADSGSSIEHPQVATNYPIADDSKISIPSTVTLVGNEREPLTAENKEVGASDKNLDHVEDQELKVDSVNGGSGEDAPAEAQASYEQTAAVNGNEVTVVDGKVSISVEEISAADDSIQAVACSEHEQNMNIEKFGIAERDSHVPAVPTTSSNEQACATEIGEVTVMDVDEVLSVPVQSSYEQTEAERGLKVTVVDGKVSKSAGEIPTSDCTDQVVACSEDEHNMKNDTFEITEKDSHVLADPISSCEQACVTEIGQVTAVDLEEASTVEGKMAGIDTVEGCCSGKDQSLEAEKVDGSCENDLICSDFKSSSKQTQIADRSDIMVTGHEVPKLEIEDVIKDGKKISDSKIDVGTCLQKDGIALVNVEACDEQFKIDNPLESSILDSQGNVQDPACCTFDDHVSRSEKAEELEVEMLGKNSLEDPTLGFDCPPTGSRNSSTQTCLDSHKDNTTLPDKDEEALAQTADTHIHDAGDLQSMNLLGVDETLGLGEAPVVHPVIVSEGATACQAADIRTAAHDNDVFIAPLPDYSGEVENPDRQDESYSVNEHVSLGQVLNKSMMGSLVVDLDACLNKEGNSKLQNDSVKENVALPDEPQFVGVDVQAMEGNAELEFSECFAEGATEDLCLEHSTMVQEVEVQEHYTDTEQGDSYGGQEIEMVEQAADHEESKGVDNSLMETTLKTGSSTEVCQENYLLPPENEGEFYLSDLVWGKVRSHPWWPGQIFDPSDASEKAIKYHKKDCFLVAYFGDRTFAWNEASLLKPFRINFSQIEKQSSSEAFQNAVSCALEEVSRRVELGLACSCIPKDAYAKIEFQNVENTGICQESSRRFGVDKSSGVSSFTPDKLVQYVRALAQSPSVGVHKLELVVAKAQLLAFNRLKGYCRLPDFQFCGGLMEENADSSQLGEVIDRVPSDERILSSTVNLKAGKSSSHKRKHNLKDIAYPRKKERSLSELMGDAASSPDGEDGFDWKVLSKSVSSSSGKKRKNADVVSDGSEVQDRRISIYAAKVSTTASPAPKPSFRVGECIRRVAGQLWSPSIIKCSGEKFQKVELSSNVPAGSDDSLQTPEDSRRGRMTFPLESASLDEMLSQLHLAAQEPVKGYSFLGANVTFFSDFRDSISLVQYSGRHNSSTRRPGGGRKKKLSHAIIGSPEEFEFDDVNDSYWTDRIIENGAEEQSLADGQNREGEYQLVDFDPEKSLKLSRRSYSRKRFSNGNHVMATEEPIEYANERKQDNSPTELILNFCEGDSIPSEINLNKIFRRFGPLKESETEVDLDSSRARVVFKKCSDAEVAFSSAGKFNIFEPLIVNYQLSYSPSISFKTLPLVTSEAQEDAT